MDYSGIGTHYALLLMKQYMLCTYSIYVFVSVFFPFILDVNFVGCTSRGHTDRRKVAPDFSSTFLLRCMPLFFSRERFSRSFPSSTVKSTGILCTTSRLLWIRKKVIEKLFFLTRKFVMRTKRDRKILMLTVLMSGSLWLHFFVSGALPYWYGMFAWPASCIRVVVQAPHD